LVTTGKWVTANFDPWPNLLLLIPSSVQSHGLKHPSSIQGLEGDVDVLPPNAVGPLELPFHYTKTFVHFLPGGYTNGHTGKGWGKPEEWRGNGERGE
jgi:hypothetical protein